MKHFALLPKKLLLIILLSILIISFSASIYVYSPLFLSQSTESLLEKHGWVVKQKIAEFEVPLPQNLNYEPGTFPIAIYWAVNNELSKSIGLDMQPYFGKKVKLFIYELQSEEPDYLVVPMKGVIVTYGNKIIGAWIDAQMDKEGFGTSLERKTRQDITEQAWGDWLIASEVVNPQNEFEVELSKMSKEQLLTEFFQALDQQNYSRFYGMIAREELMRYITLSNLDESRFDEAQPLIFGIDLHNISRVTFEGIKQCGQDEHTTCVVTLNIKQRHKEPGAVFIIDENTLDYYVWMTKEINSLGWRIKSVHLVTASAPSMGSPTQRAPDWWESASVFKQFLWLGVGSDKMAFSRPTHQRVTQTVRLLR